MKSHKAGLYETYIKRLLDIVLSFTGLVLLSPLLIVLTLIGAVAMRGNPFFCQIRPGKDEKLFKLIKFRTMSNAKDKNGNLLPDDKRINAYGKFLRSTSCDELPELWNILNGSCSVVGPRPQLVVDMLFMDEKQRRRHNVRAGLTGLAQINGRNCIAWDDKLEWDLKYISNVSFAGDLKIIFATFYKVIKRSDIVREGTSSDMDYGDWLLEQGRVSQEYHDKLYKEAKIIVKNFQ